MNLYSKITPKVMEATLPHALHALWPEDYPAPCVMEVCSELATFKAARVGTTMNTTPVEVPTHLWLHPESSVDEVRGRYVVDCPHCRVSSFIHSMNAYTIERSVLQARYGGTLKKSLNPEQNHTLLQVMAALDIHANYRGAS